MKRFIKSIKAKLSSQTGSLSVEAIISITTLLVLIFLMTTIIKTQALYETMDHCINESAKKVSGHEAYVLVASSNGLSEQIARPLIFKALLKKEMKEAGLNVNQEFGKGAYGQLIDLSVEELAHYDSEQASGTFRITYKSPLPGKLPPRAFEHQVRVRALWRLSQDENEDGQDSHKQIVYTSIRGRSEKIYHTHAGCRTLKNSWNNPDSVQSHSLESLENYRVCKVCSEKELEDSAQE